MTKTFTVNGEILTGGTDDVSLTPITRIQRSTVGNVVVIPAVANQKIKLTYLASSNTSTVKITTDAIVIEEILGLDGTRTPSEYSIGTMGTTESITAPENTSMTIEVTAIIATRDYDFTYKYVK